MNLPATPHTSDVPVGAVGVVDDWTQQLDALEATLRLVEQGQPVDQPTPWTPPASIGTLPEALVTRAKDLLARYALAEGALREQINRDRQHHDITTRMGQSSRPDAAFIDQTL